MVCRRAVLRAGRRRHHPLHLTFHQGEIVNRHPSFNEELAAHLDGKAHPLPFPGVTNMPGVNPTAAYEIMRHTMKPATRRRADIVPDLASSYDHMIREKGLIAEGFTPWFGRGACPVPGDQQVDVVYPDGQRFDDIAAADVIDWRLVAYYRPTLEQFDVAPLAWLSLGALAFAISAVARLMGVI